MKVKNAEFEICQPLKTKLDNAKSQSRQGCFRDKNAQSGVYGQLFVRLITRCCSKFKHAICI